MSNAFSNVDILGEIVLLVSVDVVNQLSLAKFSTKFFLRNKTMLVSITAYI